MPKPDFASGWKLVFAIILAIIEQVIVSIFLQFPQELQWLYVVSFSVLLIVSYGLVNIIWVVVDKQIQRKPKEKSSFRPPIQYYFQAHDDNNLLFLHINSPPQNRKKHLKLEVYRIRRYSNDKYNRLIDVDLGAIKDKRLYDGEVRIEKDKRAVLVARKSTDDKPMLYFTAVHDIGIEMYPGKYIYEFHENGKLIRKEFTYNDKGEFEV